MIPNNKILIIESCEKKILNDFSNTSIVHVRNSVIIQNILNADLISHISQIDSVKNNKYDSIICMYGSHYMRYNSYMEILDNNQQAKLFWLVNDHDLEDNILLRKWLIKYNKPYNMVCNNRRESYRHWILGKNMNGKKLNDWISDWLTVNLNCLIFDDSYTRKVKENLFQTDKSDCIYFGTFRKHRIKDMVAYNMCDYVISTSKKNQKKYQAAGINTRFTDRLSWVKGKETLYNFKYSIYFEDEHTHSNYAYMANRFYECLMLDVLIFFDYRCNLVIEKSGFIIDEFLIVHEGIELKEKIEQLDSINSNLYNDLLNKQRSNIDLVKKEKIKSISQIQNNF